MTTDLQNGAEPELTAGSRLAGVTGYLPSLITADASSGDVAQRRHGCDNNTEDVERWISDALNDLDAAIKEYAPIAVVGLMSGGNDSLPACYVASLHEKFSGILHVNTGIGIEGTRQHVRSLCASREWKLWEYKAEENVNAKGEPSPQIYEDIVMKYGFPGASMHGMMYSMLKERQLRRFERDMGADGRPKIKKRILYVSGARVKESKRRMGNAERITVEPRRVWLNVILQWNKEMCATVRDYAGLPENPVARELGMSGECLCGAFAKPGELARVRLCDPAVANRIQALEARARAAGYDWGWDESPRKSTVSRDEFELFSTPSIDQQLCGNCIFNAEVIPAVGEPTPILATADRVSTNPSTTAQADN